MIKKLIKLFNLSEIGKKLLFRVIMFSSALTLIFTGGQLYFEFKNDLHKINEIRNQIDSSYIKSIETALWSLNDEQALALLEGIVALPSVTKAVVTIYDGKVYMFQNSNVKGDISFTLELHGPSYALNRVIGILEVQQSEEEVYQNLRNRLALVLLLNFIKTFFVAFFILYLFYSLITRHLLKISDFMNHLTLIKTDEKLVLDRPENLESSADELDHFVYAFNSMNCDLYKAWKEIEYSEKRYRLLVEGSLQGIMILDNNWKFIYANDQCLMIFGFSDNTKIIYDVKNYFPKQTIDKVTNFFKTKTESSIYIDEVTLSLEKELERTTQAIFVQTVHEGLPALQVVIYDITHYKEMKKKKQDFEIQLIQNNKMASVGTMLSGVTHEINNPNHMIKQNSIILGETWNSLKPVLEKYNKGFPSTTLNNLTLSEILTIMPILIDDIKHGSDNITCIINDLKSFVRQDQNYDVVQFNVNKTIEDSTHLLRTSINKRCHDFQLKLDDSIPNIWGYPQRLSQVFINLIINALDSLEAPLKKIIIRTFFKDDKVFISFKDEGIGISKNIVNKVFDAFYSTKLDTGGTGLGLSISQSIISQHHGKISINTDVIEGAELIIELPVNKKPMNITLGI